MSNVIKVKYFGDQEALAKSEKGDMIDLRSAVTVSLKKGEYKRIPLGVAMKLPEGMTGIIVPRSSSFEKWGFIQTNGVGIIDNSYCGDLDQWQYPIYCTKDTTIHRGDRICQFGLINFKMRDYTLERADKLDDDNRSGFGSTGIK